MIEAFSQRVAALAGESHVGRELLEISLGIFGQVSYRALHIRDFAHDVQGVTQETVIQICRLVMRQWGAKTGFGLPGSGLFCHNQERVRFRHKLR